MTTATRISIAAAAAVLLTGAAREEHSSHETAPRAKASHAVPSTAATVHHGPHWGYEGAAGPDAWGDLAAEFNLCKTGHMQSPVDLGGADLTGNFGVKASYKAAPLTILNNGHTVQVNFPEGSTLASGPARYKLLQVHFHTPSEETIYGIHYPMVAHFVHVDYAGNLAVLGVLFEEGAPNKELDKIIRHAPVSEQGAQTYGVTVDPAGLLPDNLAVYRYEGSLTTPPCSEGVRWHVATHRVTAGSAQIAAIHAIVGDNARPVQPRYGRLLVAGAD